MIDLAELEQRLASPDWVTRARAVKDLAFSDHPAAIDLLLTLIRRESQTAYYAVLGLARRLDDPRSGAALIAALDHESDYIRQTVAGAIGDARLSAAIPRLLERLASHDPEDANVRGRYAIALAAFGDRHVAEILAARSRMSIASDGGRALATAGATKELLAIATDVNEPHSWRSVAAYALAETDAAPELVALLDTEPELSAVAEEALAKLAVTDLLVAAWRGVDAARAAALIRLLSRVAVPQAQMFFEAALAKPLEPDAAALGLARLGSALGFDALIATLRRPVASLSPIIEIGRALTSRLIPLLDESPLVAQRAALALGVIGDATACAPLAALLRSSAPRAPRFMAGFAMARLGESALLIEIGDEPAAYALGFIDVPLAHTALHRLARAASHDVRELAAASLDRLHGRPSATSRCPSCLCPDFVELDAEQQPYDDSSIQQGHCSACGEHFSSEHPFAPVISAHGMFWLRSASGFEPVPVLPDRG